jgi:hypothetical protein
MKARTPKKDRKRPVNLTLTPEAVRLGKALKKQLHRGSFSNVVEHLIIEAHKKAA